MSSAGKFDTSTKPHCTTEFIVVIKFATDTPFGFRLCLVRRVYDFIIRWVLCGRLIFNMNATEEFLEYEMVFETLLNCLLN